MVERHTSVILFDSGRLSDVINDARAITELANHPPRTFEVNQLGAVGLALESSPLAFITALDKDDFDHREHSAARPVVQRAIGQRVPTLLLSNDKRAERAYIWWYTRETGNVVLPIMEFYDLDTALTSWLGGVAKRNAQA